MLVAPCTKEGRSWNMKYVFNAALFLFLYTTVSPSRRCPPSVFIFQLCDVTPVINGILRRKPRRFFRHMQGAHSLLLELSWLLLLVLLPHAYWQMFVLPKTNPLKEWLVRTPEWRRQLKIFILERSREDSRKSQGPL